MRRQKRGEKVGEMAFHKAKKRATINKTSLKMLVPTGGSCLFKAGGYPESRKKEKNKKEKERKEKK